jgi:hypothetical protein
MDNPRIYLRIFGATASKLIVILNHFARNVNLYERRKAFANCGAPEDCDEERYIWA